MKNEHVIEREIKGKEWETILDNTFKKRIKDVKVDGFRKVNVQRIFIYKNLVLNLYLWMHLILLYNKHIKV